MTMQIPHDDSSLADEDYETLVKQHHVEQQEKLNPVVDCLLSPFVTIVFLYKHQRTEFILGLILLASVTLAITGIVEEVDHKLNPYIDHHITHAYDDNVQSKYDLKLGNIDHWCIDGTDETCPFCSDPTEASNHMESKGWARCFGRNKHLAMAAAKGANAQKVDVVFLGDGLTEAKIGMKKGRPHPQLQQVAQDFQSIFGPANTKAKYSGVPLGIYGDTTKNLLWRIQKGEFAELKPRVWWISIGIHDLISTDCSEEITLIGILRIVEELVARKDGSTIVINSLLPTTASTHFTEEDDTSKKHKTHSSYKYSGRHSHNEISKSIAEVNTKLASFASKHNGIKFFDATPHFLKSSSSSTKYLKKELYLDSHDLSAEGHLVWMTQQAQAIANILKKKQEVQELIEKDDTEALEAWEPIMHYSEVKPDHRYYDLGYYDNIDEFEDDIFK